MMTGQIMPWAGKWSAMGRFTFFRLDSYTPYFLFRLRRKRKVKEGKDQIRVQYTVTSNVRIRCQYALNLNFIM
jgi:hypothetical protein